MNEKPMGCVNCGADDHDTKDCMRLPVVAWQVEFPLGNGAKVYEQRPSWAYESYGDLAYVTHELCRLTDAQALLAEKDARIAQLAAHARGKNKALANALKEIERLKRTIETGLDNELALVGERADLRAEVEQLKRKNDRQSESIKRYQDEGQGSFLELDILRARVIELEKLQAAPAERVMIAEVAELYCPEAYGFEGPETFPDCGTCVVCRAKSIMANGGLSPVPTTAAQPWIPVSERLPDIAQEVVVNTQFEGVFAGVLDSYGEWFAPCSEYKLNRITHWMPLPAAPATADSDVREVK